MLLDRNLIVDLIVVEFMRENRYRHPPLYHCIIIKHSGKEEHAENCMKNTHVHTFELIEERFDSNSWFVLFLGVLMLCS